MKNKEIKELLRLASLVGTDAKEPERNLIIFIKSLLEKIERDAWVDGFMETGEGYNGEYCSGHGGNGVNRKEVENIYNELKTL